MIEGGGVCGFGSTPLKYFGGGREPEGSDALRFSPPGGRRCGIVGGML